MISLYYFKCNSFFVFTHDHQLQMNIIGRKKKKKTENCSSMNIGWEALFLSTICQHENRQKSLYLFTCCICMFVYCMMVSKNQFCYQLRLCKILLELRTRGKEKLMQNNVQNVKLTKEK